MPEPTQEDALRELGDVARVGEEMEAFLRSDAYATARAVVQGRIFEEWTTAATLPVREALHAEQRALDRLQEAFETIEGEGLVAREAIRRANEESTPLSDPA